MAYCGCLELTKKKRMAGNQTCTKIKHPSKVINADHYSMTAETLSLRLDVLFIHFTRFHWKWVITLYSLKFIITPIFKMKKRFIFYMVPLRSSQLEAGIFDL
jgi:hypothetical protein